MVLKNMQDVAAAVFEKDGRVFIARRSFGRKHAGFWEFPGGRVEKGETPEACLVRELKEELDIEAHVGSKLWTCETDRSCGSNPLRILFYSASGDTSRAVLRVHDKAEWVPVNKLLEYALAPADLDFVLHRYFP